MKHKPFNLIAVFLLSSACAVGAEDTGSQQPLRITLDGLKAPRPESYLLGEPITVRFTWENLADQPLTIALKIGPPWTSIMSLKVEGKTDPDCDLFGQLAAIGYLDGHQVMQPKERIDRYIDVTQMGMVDVGEYNIWLEYDAAGIGENFAGGAVAPIRVESNHLRFEIVAPQGVDSQAFEEYASDKCNRMPEHGELKDKIIRDFPTSTYVGWILLGSPRPIDPVSIPGPGLFPDKISEDPVLRPSSIRIRDEKRLRFAKNVEDLSDYLSARPDFKGADRMRFQIAWYQCFLGRFEDAREVLDVVLAEDGLPTWLRRQSEALREFATKKSSFAEGEH